MKFSIKKFNVKWPPSINKHFFPDQGVSLYTGLTVLLSLTFFKKSLPLFQYYENGPTFGSVFRKYTHSLSKITPETVSLTLKE
jgi:hypothetical protein